MNQESIDRHFKIFSIVQAVIILIGGYTSVNVNFQLGWDWTYFLLAVLFGALLSLFTYYIYKYHRLSAMWAVLIWAIQIITIESPYVSWTMSLGMAISIVLNLGETSIRLNLFALPMLIWVAYITLKQRTLTRTNSDTATAVNPSLDGSA